MLLLIIYLGGFLSFVSGATIIGCSAVLYFHTREVEWLHAGDGGVILLALAAFTLWIAQSMSREMRECQNTDKDKIAPDAEAQTQTAPTVPNSEKSP